MKSLIALSASAAAILTAYIGTNNSFHTANIHLLSDHSVVTARVARFCPDDGGIITRNLRDEGVVSKIKVQSVKGTTFVNIQSDSE